MLPDANMNQVRQYYDGKIKTYGATPQGTDWNSDVSQEIRFEQLCKVITQREHVSILDFGCGYGALYDYLIKNGYQVDLYVGYDIVETMVQEGKRLHSNQSNLMFTSNLNDIPLVDYAVASGVFHVKLKASSQDWLHYIQTGLADLNQRVRKGFSSNFLTSYSDAERMTERPDLYFADPCYLFDYCKKNFSRWVAINHDYRLYDFTIIVRKEPV
jgi:SAM-dependent methyltransferase